MAPLPLKAPRPEFPTPSKSMHNATTGCFPSLFCHPWYRHAKDFRKDRKRWRKPCQKGSVWGQRYAGSNFSHRVSLGGNKYICRAPGCTLRPGSLAERVWSKKVPQLPPFIYPHYAWLGQDFLWRTTVHWQGSAEYTQECTGRRLNYFRKDEGRKYSKKFRTLVEQCFFTNKKFPV